MQRNFLWSAFILLYAIAQSSGASLHAQVSSTPTAAPAPADKPQVILFVGNSFTHGRFASVRTYNAAAVIDENFDLPREDPRADRFTGEPGPHGGVPGIFKQLTDQAGLRYEVHVDAVSATPLGFHREHSLPLIAQKKWDAVVFQEYSTVPLPVARGGKPESFLADSAQLEQAVHAVNPAARLYLYETWPRADMIYPAGSRYHGEPVDAMGNDLHECYQRAFAADGHFAGVAWVGDTWLDAIHAGAARANPYPPVKQNQNAKGQNTPAPQGGQARGFDLWGEDHYHAGTHGAYLAALVLFREITQGSPRRLGAGERAAHDLGITPQDAVRLQAIAETAGHPLAR